MSIISRRGIFGLFAAVSAFSTGLFVSSASAKSAANTPRQSIPVTKFTIHPAIIKDLNTNTHELIGDPSRVGSLVIVRAKEDWNGRGTNGMLLDAPKMYFIVYNEECHCLRAEPIAFRAAEVLVPSEYGVVIALLNAARGPEYAKYGHSQSRRYGIG